MTSNAIADKIAQNAAFNFINTLAGFVTAMALSIIVARYLGPELFGIYSLVIWMMSTVGMCINLGMTSAITKYVAELRSRNDHDVIARIIGFGLRFELIIAAGIGILLTVFASQVAIFFSIPNGKNYIIIVALGTIPGVSMAVLLATLTGLQKYGYLALANLVVSAFSFALSVAALLMGYGIFGLLIAAVATRAMNLLIYWRLLQKERISPSIATLGGGLKNRILRYNFSVTVIRFIDAVVWQRSETFFLGRFSTAGQIAYYNVGYGLSERVIALIPGSLVGILMPLFSEMYGTGSNQSINKIFVNCTRYLAMLTLPICIGGIVLATPLVEVMYTPAYSPAAEVLRLTLVAGTLGSLAGVASSMLYGIEKQGFIVKFGLLIAFLNIFLDLGLIGRFGALGAAIANSTAQGLAAIGGIYYASRIRKVEYPLDAIFRIGIASVIMGIVAYIVINLITGIRGLVASVVLGTVTYLIALILAGAIESEDVTLLKSLTDRLPPPVRPVYLSLLDAVPCRQV